VADGRALTRIAKIQVAIGIVALGITVVAAVQLVPLVEKKRNLEADVKRLEGEEAAWKQRVKALQTEYSKVKTSAEQLYGVLVTPDNQVYELKATAQPTGRVLSLGPEYRFTIFVNSSPEALAAIRRVTYHFEHATFKQKDYIAEDQKDRFMMSYVGWGCLSNVTVTVDLRAGTKHAFDFDMCRSLAPHSG
jgi:hypothetical protein